MRKWLRRYGPVVAALCFALAPPPSNGQAFAAAAHGAAPPVEPSVPSLAVSDDQLGDARKYFVLHKAGVSPEEAQADLTFCWRFLPHGQARSVPGFVPWQRATAAKPIDYSSGYPMWGLMTFAIGALVDGPIERSVRQSRLIRCMAPRGYTRYRTSEAVWRQLNTDDAAQSIRLQAQIAAGPIPPTPQVSP